VSRTFCASYAKQHVLYRALRAFGRIIKSVFILRYIDDVGLRQAIDGVPVLYSAMI